MVLRGGGLFAVKSEDEKKNEAAAVFAKWITEKQHNLDFVTQAGYIPVCSEAMDELFSDLSIVEDEKYRMLYSAIAQQQNEGYTYCAIPLFEGSADVQSDFEAVIKNTLSTAHSVYINRVMAGEDAEAVLNELLAETLDTIREKMK